MAISFNELPALIRAPGVYIEFDGSRAVENPPAKPHKVLVIGQQLSTATVAEATINKIFSDAKAEEFHGVGSMIAEEVRAYRKIDRLTEISTIALDEEAAGVVAAGTFTFAGTATEAGEMVLYIAGERFAIAVADGDTAAELETSGTAFIIGQGARYTRLPITALADAVGTGIDITCKWKGTTGNKIDLRTSYNDGEKIPAGLTVTITAMVGGATDPAMSDIVTAIGEVQFDTIITPYSDATSLTALQAHLVVMWGGTVQKEGHLFAADTDTVGNLTTLGNSRNDEFVTIMGGGVSPTPPWIWAAATAAADVVVTKIDPFLPRVGRQLIGVLPPAQTDLFTWAQRDTLLTDGISTFTEEGGKVLVDRLITTYQTKSAVPDTTYLKIQTLRGLALLRFEWRARVLLKYQGYKLAQDGTNFAPGQKVVTPSTIKAEAHVQFRNWETRGFVEDFDQFKDELIVEINDADKDRIDLRMGPNLINQFNVLAGQMQFIN